MKPADPAFPCCHTSNYYHGVPIRLWIATHALFMVEPRSGNVISKLNPDYAKAIAQDCLTMADALIAEHNATSNPGK